MTDTLRRSGEFDGAVSAPKKNGGHNLAHSFRIFRSDEPHIWLTPDSLVASSALDEATANTTDRFLGRL